MRARTLERAVVDEEFVPASAPLNRLLERRRLNDALRTEIDARDLVALIAPAGYGKTSAIVEALDGSARPSVWYRARAWHRGEFIIPLVAEIRAVRPDFGRMTLALAQRHPAERASEGAARDAAALGGRLGATFAAELEHVREELVLVIDDAHVLDDDPLFAAFFSAAFEARPQGIRFIITARTAPRLPFAAWIAGGRCATFAADDLRFGDDEVLELARRFGAKDVPLEQLRERFDGWAAGLALFFAAGERTIPAEGRSLDAYSAYLIDANLAALDASLVNFLEATCVYERLDAEILERHAAIADVRVRLAELERSGVMVAVERPGSIYRLHPLLREALRGRVRARDGEEALRAAHGRAADALESAGALEAALYHIERAGDAAFAAGFFIRHGHELFIAGMGERAVRIARSFAPSAPLAEATSALLEGMLLRQYGLPGAAERLSAGMRAAERAGSSGAEEATRLGTSLRLVATEDALSRRVPPSADDLAWLEATAAEPSDLHAAAEASMYAGWTHAIAGDFARARAGSARALALAGAALFPRVRATALDAYAATCSGHFEEADRELTLVVNELETSDALVLLANTLVWYARLALLWGDVASARDYAEQGHALSQRLDLGAELAGVALARAQIAAHDGDLERLRTAANDARRFASSAWYVADRARSLALATLLDARATFVSSGPAHGLVRLERLAEPIPPLQRLCATIEEAAYRRAAHERPALERVRAALARAETDALRAHDALDAVELERSLRIANMLGIAIPAALAAANRAIFGGLLNERSAREEGDPARADPTYAALDHRIRHERGERERDAAPSRETAEEAPQASPLQEALTRREREILELLALGLTNKEIAQRLVVSPRTVDTHVERVLAKLGVPSRTRAIATALRIGLVAAP